MKYEIIWNAVDNLAKSLGSSPSGLAKKAGLDATTFNKSKRIRPDGKNRWPSLESLNKIFEVCGITFEEFYEFGNQSDIIENLKVIPFCKLTKLSGNLNFTREGIDTHGWKKTSFPDSYGNLYALEIDNNKFQSDIRNGTTLIISKNSDIRKDDKIIAYTKDGKMIIADFIHRTAKALELMQFGKHRKEVSVNISDIAVVDRIIWISA